MCRVYHEGPRCSDQVSSGCFSVCFVWLFGAYVFEMFSTCFVWLFIVCFIWLFIVCFVWSEAIYDERDRLERDIIIGGFISFSSIVGSPRLCINRPIFE